MQPEARDIALLWDMLEAARDAARFVSGVTYPAYRANWEKVRAVERSIEIVGEAARKVSKAFQELHPEIPWHKITSQRHILAHEYGKIDQERIWEVATVHVPALIAALEPLVPPPPEMDDLDQ